MTQRGEVQFSSGFPRPGPALRGVLVGVFVVWIVFATTINWGPNAVARPALDVFALLIGDTDQIFLGQLWRLLTAAVLNSPQGLSDILLTLLGLYFLSPSLESSWGSDRFLKFLVASASIAYGLQAAVLYLLPPFAGERLAGSVWYGSLPILEAIAIAWATSFKGRVVRLFMILPVTGHQLIWIVVGLGVLGIIALSGSQSGLVAPFGGMLSGWLLGGSPSTLRRWYLRLKLKQSEQELARLKQERLRRVAATGFRVIEGGRADNARDSEADSGPDSGDGGGPVLH